MREVVVFRNNLFRISEPFVTQQAGQCQGYQPVYLGRLRFGPPPPGAASFALADAGRWRSMASVAWQVASRSPAGFGRLLAGHAPALVHAHFGIDGVYALPLARRLGVPLVTTFHGFDATLSTAAMLCSPAWANYPLHRAGLARDGALFLCVSSFIRDQVLAQGFDPARTHVHYTGVDCDATRPRDPGEETATILHVARLVEMKGTATLLHAFAGLAPRHPGVSLVVIGDGPLRRSLERLAGALGVAERVRFLGARPHAEVMGWMRRAAMLVLPSVRTATGRVEGLGMVLLEAAATGVPVVGSRVGGIPEGLSEGETGLLAPARDAEALGARMGELLDDPERRRRMGAAARGFVERRFDLGRQTAALERFYDSVLPPVA
ncbi:MAG: glycosyltransferase [Janthinobacterium lividum]